MLLPFFDKKYGACREREEVPLPTASFFPISENNSEIRKIICQNPFTNPTSCVTIIPKSERLVQNGLHQAHQRNQKSKENDE